MRTRRWNFGADHSSAITPSRPTEVTPFSSATHRRSGPSAASRPALSPTPTQRQT